MRLIRLSRCLILPGLLLVPFAQAQDGLLNERPVMPRSEYERLWQVDCSEVREKVKAAARDEATNHAETLLEPLRRCAFIDDALGMPPRHARLRLQLIAWLDGSPTSRAEILAEKEAG